ncbi:MAG: cell division protein ZapA [Rhodobacteraceae bacterium]|jgi:cell division protein ZapA|nr:cell division protein ZapA [Paracoccaceae bacterium]
MAEVEIRIGGRPFMVACQPGEESYLESAARLLDAEASALVQQLGKMPESQMLLMAGLMLADKTAGLEEKLRTAPAAARPSFPADLADRLDALAERAEAVAAEVEESVPAP